MGVSGAPAARASTSIFTGKLSAPALVARQAVKNAKHSPRRMRFPRLLPEFCMRSRACAYSRCADLNTAFDMGGIVHLKSAFILFFACIGSCFAAEPTPPSNTPQASPPAEWVDAATGHRVVRLSTEPGTRSLYFHQNSL